MSGEAPGWSEYTASKQAMFRALATSHQSCVFNMPRDRPWCYPRYLYVDGSTGPGVDQAGEPGWAVIMKDIADQLGLPLDRWLFEFNPKTMTTLRQHIGADLHARLIDDDFRHRYGDVIDHYRRIGLEVYGMVGYDPNGDPLPVVPLNVLTTGHLARLDLALHIAANSAYKRREWFHGRDIAGDLAEINKKFWRISRINTHHQYALLIGTNYPKLAVNRNLGMVPFESDEGQRRWAILSMTAVERQAALQPSLPFLDGTSLIETTRNISGIHGSDLYVPWHSRGPAAAVNAAEIDRRPKLTT